MAHRDRLLYKVRHVSMMLNDYFGNVCIKGLFIWLCTFHTTVSPVDMLEFESCIWQDCILPEICDTQEMYTDTGLILFAEECNDTLLNTAAVVYGEDVMKHLHTAEEACGLDVTKDTVKRHSRHTGRVHSKTVQIKMQRKNHSVETVYILSAHFDSNSKPNYMEKQNLANKTGISVDQVSAWFNNKRKRTCGAAAVE